MKVDDLGYWILFIFICVILLAGARGQAIEIHQGDKVYLNETVDISLAVSWPDFKIAWCANEAYGCVPPDQVINITGNMHRYYIDPAFYHLGSYYRWDGTWHTAENMDAFTVRNGTRPNVTAEPNVTVTLEPEPTVIPFNNTPVLKNPTHILLARGDVITYTYTLSGDAPQGNGHLWLFGGDARYNFKRLMDLPLERTGQVYRFEFNQTFSESLDYGKYSGYLQFDSNNNFQDVFYNQEKDILDSPYKDVKSVSLAGGITPELVKSSFERMERDPIYSDDLIIPLSMEIVLPGLHFTEYYEVEDAIYMEGITTMHVGTDITAIIDPDKWVRETEKQQHTVQVPVTGALDQPRIFSVSLPIVWDDMAIGDHQIRFTVHQPGLGLTQDKWFHVTNTYVMPDPTPTTKKGISGEYGWKVITTIPSPTPTPIRTVTQVQSVSVPVYSNETPIPVKTQVPTSVKPTPVPTTESVVIPLNPVLGLIALGIAWVIIWRR